MPAKEKARARSLRLLIVDDHPIVRHGLAQLIAAEPDMEVCGQATSAAEALEVVAAAAPDVAVVDISLENESGLRLIQQIRERYPEVKTLVSSIHDEATYAPRALKAGAMGYIEKRESITRIIEAVRHVLEGKVYLSPKMTNQLLHHAATGKPFDRNPASTLSNRELEVFEKIGRGETVQQIARKLGVSPKTIESHRKKIREKLNLKNSAQLSRCAITWVNDQY
jgi:DNA-binding NarL/FixJ family response regulator